MLSVLMSVYNESLDEIKQSLDSILTQSYRDFELIIVLDQPNYVEGLDLLNQYARKDSRIRVLVNEKNIGLAMSMNYAATYAKGKYLLRMDADDICMPNRFQLEYDAICDGKYDLICGNYDFIDEDGTILPQKAKIYTDSQLDSLLPYRNIIHHPTVIMTAEILNKVGGYRNYPCAQDYDLWLRMKCVGARMHMMPEKLIQYRVRQASTTIQKRYKQSCTGEYIRKLYRENNQMQGYSYDGYLSYLEKRNANSSVANKNFIENFNRYMQSKMHLKQGKFFKGIAELVNVFFCSKYYRPHILQNIKIMIITQMKQRDS